MNTETKPKPAEPSSTENHTAPFLVGERVTLRTICVAGRRLSYRVGGGITLGSDPEAERVETLDKGRALAEAVLGVGVEDRP